MQHFLLCQEVYTRCPHASQVEVAAAREALRGARKDAVQMRNESTTARALYDIASAKAAEQGAQVALCC